MNANSGSPSSLGSSTSLGPSETMPGFLHSPNSIRSRLLTLSRDSRKGRSLHEERGPTAETPDPDSFRPLPHRSLLSRSWAAAATVIRKKTGVDSLGEGSKPRCDSGAFCSPDSHIFAPRHSTDRANAAPAGPVSPSPQEAAPLFSPQPDECGQQRSQQYQHPPQHFLSPQPVQAMATSQNTAVSVLMEESETELAMISPIQVHEIAISPQPTSLRDAAFDSDLIRPPSPPVPEDRMHARNQSRPGASQVNSGTSTPASSLVMDALSRVIPTMPSIPSTLRQAYSYTGLGLSSEAGRAAGSPSRFETPYASHATLPTADFASLPPQNRSSSAPCSGSGSGPASDPALALARHPGPANSDDTAVACSPRMDVNWELASQGLKLLDSSLAESRMSYSNNLSFPPDPLVGPHFSRHLYLRAVGHLLRGMPEELSESEYQLLQSCLSDQHRQRLSLPSDRNDGSFSGTGPTDWITWSTMALSGETGSDPNSALMQGRSPSFLHQITAIVILQFFYLLHFLLPVGKTVIGRAYRYERENRVTERFLGLSLTVFDFWLAAILRIAAMQGGRVGQLFTALFIWFLRSVLGGLNEGLVLGLGVFFDELRNPPNWQQTGQQESSSPALHQERNGKTGSKPSLLFDRNGSQQPDYTRPAGNEDFLQDEQGYGTPATAPASFSPFAAPRRDRKAIASAPLAPSLASLVSLSSLVLPHLVDRGGRAGVGARVSGAHDRVQGARNTIGRCNSGDGFKGDDGWKNNWHGGRSASVGPGLVPEEPECRGTKGW